jgi:hypothetical protein
MIAGWWIDLGFEAPPADASFHAVMGHGCAEHAPAAPAAGDAAGSCCDHQGATEQPVAAAMTSSAGGGFWAMALSWMTGLMLLGAVPPAFFLTRCAELARSGWRRWVSTHLIGNLLMICGMIWLGHWIGPGLGRLLGSNAVGAHLGMLLGMLIGMEAGMFAGEAVLGLKPWREWTWQKGVEPGS